MSGFVDILKGVRALIEELELKSAKRAETLDGGRLEGDHDRAGDPEQGAAESMDDGGGSVLAALALRVRLKGQEGETGVGRGASKAEAGYGEGAPDFRNSFGDRGHLLADPPGVVKRSSGGRLHGDDKISLIFGGDKALGDFPKDEVGETESGGKEDQSDDFKTQHRAQNSNVAVVNRGQYAVDALEEPVLFPVLATEQERGERGRKGQGVEGGDGDGEGNGQRELAEQNAGCSGEEGHGHEDGDQHQ